ncbi:motility associated factor glycosyltransferase family protein [Paenibacillus sp. YIM B09110]|uniref:motility associated factor glycosyltransferase family protein n=1 Tax=Paenibacillus sp. YIM B09110 TaxID=3126102 RepID=UPI00301C3431
MDQQLSEINSSMTEIVLFLPKLIEASSNAAESMVVKPTDEEWRQIVDIIEGIDDLYKALSILSEDLHKLGYKHVLQPVIETAVNEIKDKFYAMNTAMDQDNYIEASDCISFELIPVFHRLTLELGQDDLQRGNRFEFNANYLQSHKPYIYEGLDGLTKDIRKYQTVTSKSGLPNLYVEQDGQAPFFLNSRYNPEHEVERWSNKLTVTSHDVTSAFFFGFGLGYHVQHYMELYPNHKIYIYEPDIQIFLAAMEVVDFQSLFENNSIASFVVGNDRKQREAMFYHFARYMKGEPQLFALPMYDRIAQDDLHLFFKEAVSAVTNFNSSIKMTEMFGAEWVRNSLYNLSATLHSPSLAGLKSKFDGKTAVIIGAGPSLELDVEWLLKLKKHAILIAAGSAVQSLLHYGITPHLIVSIDGGESNYNVFKNINIEGIPLVYAPMINYQIIDRNPRNLVHVFLDNDCTMDHFLDAKQEEPRFLSTYSVTGTAIQAAIYMGCNTIIFTGQDLSYPDNTMYAAGTRHKTDEEMKEVVNSAELFVDNVHGGKNRVSPGMEQTLANIEDLLERFPHIRFVNSSSKGAKIKHTVYQPMDEVYHSLNRELIDESIVMDEMAKLRLYNENRISVMMDKIKRLPTEMNKFEATLIKLEQQISQLPEWSRTNTNKCLNTFYQIDSEWKAMLRSDPFQGLYLKVCRNELLEFERDLPEFAGESDLIKKANLAVKTMLPLIQSMQGKTSEFKSMVSEMLERIKNKM